MEIHQIQRFPDIVYHDNQCKLDVYSPVSRSGARTTLVMIHGGAWHWGSKDSMRAQADLLARCGYCVVTISYRLSPLSVYEWFYISVILGLLFLCLLWVASRRSHRLLWSALGTMSCIGSLTSVWKQEQNTVKHPAHVHDVVRAIHWVQDHISEYGGDPQRIILWGHSAGAHLASLAACNRSLWYRPPRHILGVICLSGVYSWARMQHRLVGMQVAQGSLGNAPDAFPITHISRQSPPHLLIHAQLDYNLQEHMRDMYIALYEKGVYVDYLIHPGTHFDMTRDWLFTQRPIMKRMLSFIRQLEKAHAEGLI